MIKKNPIKQWKEDHGKIHGSNAVLAGFEKSLAAYDSSLKKAYDEWDVDLQLKLFDFVIAQIKETVVTTRTAILDGMEDTSS
jgi:hypothetical protein